jgi:hypothetical protein
VSTPPTAQKAAGTGTTPENSNKTPKTTPVFFLALRNEISSTDKISGLFPHNVAVPVPNSQNTTKPPQLLVITNNNIGKKRNNLERTEKIKEYSLAD